MASTSAPAHVPASLDRILSFSRPRPVLSLPETRASLINDAVLLNPVVQPPRGDLLSTFQANEAQNLDQIKNLGSPKGKGKAVVTVDLVSSSPAPAPAPVEEKPVNSGRPKRGAAKRAAEGFPKKPAPTKKGRKTV